MPHSTRHLDRAIAILRAPVRPQRKGSLCPALEAGLLALGWRQQPRPADSYHYFTKDGKTMRLHTRGTVELQCGGKFTMLPAKAQRNIILAGQVSSESPMG